jgi:hypothetical protein
MMAPVVAAVASHSASLRRPVGEDTGVGACSEAFDTDIPSFDFPEKGRFTGVGQTSD